MADIERKLATIRTVSELKPIPDADRIVLAIVGGWQCVVGKTDFSVGDSGVFFEIDSLVPDEDPRFSFLAKGNSVKKNVDGTHGYRLRTIKLKHQLSQGLMMPLSLFPEIKDAKAGDDVTELLHIVKYEPPIPANLGGLVKGNYPPFIEKTDQERIQNIPTVLQDNKNMLWEVTEKLNGTSCTIYFNHTIFGDPLAVTEFTSFGVCSRNLEWQRSENNVYWKVAIAHNLEEKLRALGRNIAIQGEVIGEGINKNPYGLKGQDIYVFDVYDIDQHRKMTPQERFGLADSLGLLSVPLKHPAKRDDRSVNEVLQWVSTMHSALNPTIPVEGVVYKSVSLVNGQPISFKVLNNEVLLKEE